MRLARHYLGKLRKASNAVRRGHGSTAYGLRLFENEWEQIKAWQAWASTHEEHDPMWAQVCRDFALAGLELLSIQGNLTEIVGSKARCELPACWGILRRSASFCATSLRLICVLDS
jgi:hypothetical protein